MALIVFTSYRVLCFIWNDGNVLHDDAFPHSDIIRKVGTQASAEAQTVTGKACGALWPPYKLHRQDRTRPTEYQPAKHREGRSWPAGSTEGTFPQPIISTPA